MKKLIMFLAGMMLMLLMCAALFMVGAIYNTGSKATIETFFFQPASEPSGRPGVPATYADLGDAQMRDMLIEKYITEFWHVVPDTADVLARMNGDTALARLSGKDAFMVWREKIAPEIQDMAEHNMLRTVSLISALPEPNTKDYWRIEYELKTWNKSNDLSIEPEITRGIMYMYILYESGIREHTIQGIPIEQYLESGQDPVAIFKFGVLDVVLQ